MRPGVLDPDHCRTRPRCGRGASASMLHRAASIIGPFPDRNGSMTRPSSLDRDQLLACGRGEMFGPGNARLPLPPMLMFDRITQIASEGGAFGKRSEEHTSELQSLMRISYAVFCLKKKNNKNLIIILLFFIC